MGYLYHGDPDLRYDQTHDQELQEARDTSWGVKTVGVTTPHPAEQFTLTMTESGCCSDMCHKCEAEHLICVVLSDDLISPVGPTCSDIQLVRLRKSTPYIGNTVSEGIIQRKTVSVTKSPPFHDAVRLNTLRKWVCEPGSEFESGLIHLIDSRTNTPHQLIDEATGIPSRLSHNHRAALMEAKKKCAISTTTNMASRMYLSSNLMGVYSHGQDNYSMPFGPTFLFIQQMISLVMIYNPKVGRSSSRFIVHAHVRSPNVPKVYDGGVRIDKPLKLSMNTNIANPLFSDMNNMVFRTSPDLPVGICWVPFNLAGLNLSRLAYAAQLVGNSVVEEISVREQITLLVRGEFPRRDSIVSIGDIKLVGVPRLIRAISSQLFLMAPSRLWRAFDESDFYPSAADYIDKLSSDFWSLFSNSLINPRIIGEIIKLVPNSVRSMSSKNARFLQKPLQDAVILDMWKLHQEVHKSLFDRQLQSPWIILAPTCASAKYLLSKWAEAHINMLGQMKNIPDYDLTQYGRDFSHNVLSTPHDQLNIIVSAIRADFVDVCKVLGISDMNLHLPWPRFLNLSLPWVEKIRDIPKKKAKETDDRVEIIDHFTSSSMTDNFVTINSPGKLTEIPCFKCDCLPVSTGFQLREECFFMQSGVLSKSFYRFMDILSFNRLPVHNVICLGTSTGSEAACISKLKGCKFIYVNCLTDLRDFSPHAAATYIPSAFLVEGFPEKLVNIGPATTAPNDLLTDEGLNSILSHTKGKVWSGVTCDAELKYGSSMEERELLVVNLLRIVNQRVVEGGWAIMKLPLKCVHEVQLVITLFGKLFRNVKIGVSPFSNSNQSLFMIVGMNLMAISATPTSSGTIFSVLLENRALDNLFDFNRNHHLPFMCSLDKETRIRKMGVGYLMRDSTAVAQDSFIRGWLTELNFYTCPKERVIQSLLCYRSAAFKCIFDTIFVNKRMFKGGNIPRSLMLSSQGPLINQLQLLLGKINRAELLLSLLYEDKFSFRRTKERIASWHSRNPIYSIGGAKVEYEVNSTYFVRHYSRYLYELLGAIYRHEFDDDDDEELVYFSLHKRQIVKLHQMGKEFSVVELPLTRSHYNPDECFSWPRRSRALTCLYILSIVKGDTKICLDFPHLVEDLRVVIPSRNIDCVRDDDPDADLIWSVTISQLWSLVNQRRDSEKALYTVINTNEFVALSELFYIEACYSIPYTGHGSEHVLAKISRHKYPSAKMTGNFFPDVGFTDRSNYSSGLSLIGCCCYSCAFEVYVTGITNVSSQYLDQICSLGRIESIRDLKH